MSYVAYRRNFQGSGKRRASLLEREHGELVYYPAPFGYTGFYSDFHNNLNHNPCPNTRERGEE